MSCRILLALALLCVTLSARADALPNPVINALNTARIPADSVAVVVHPVDGGTPLLAYRAGEAMNPASVMKLLTTYAALDLLGPGWTWKTTAWAEHEARHGQLAGNLYLQGSGDPRFAIEHLWILLRQLRTRGIQHIGGDIVLDRSAFDVPAMDSGAFDDKPMRPYNVGPDGLLINFRALRFTLLAEQGHARVLLETPSEGLRIDNQVAVTQGECASSWKDQITVRLLADNGGHRLEFSGRYALRCGERTLHLAPLPADLQAGGLIRSLWRELGGTLNGQVRPGTLPPGARQIVQHESPPLADAVRDINKFSNNVMARQLFLALGGDDKVATVERARQRVGTWLAGRRLRFDELVIDNGSGLSRHERISADSLNRLLLDAWRSPVMPEFVASLPIVGIDGTMKKRLKTAAASGRAHIKTGTLDGVKTAAGYAMDSQGRHHAVTILINHPHAQAGGPAIDALIDWIAKQRDGMPAPASAHE